MHALAPETRMEIPRELNKFRLFHYTQNGNSNTKQCKIAIIRAIKFMNICLTLGVMAAYQGFRKVQAVQSLVRPVLSCNSEEARARVLSLYRSCLRQTPYLRT